MRARSTTEKQSHCFNNVVLTLAAEASETSEGFEGAAEKCRRGEEIVGKAWNPCGMEEEGDDGKWSRYLNRDCGDTSQSKLKNCVSQEMSYIDNNAVKACVHIL